MSKRRRRKLAMARRRARESAATRLASRARGAVIATIGPGDGTTRGRYRVRALRAPPVPRVVDDFFLGPQGPRLVKFKDGSRVVVTDPVEGRVERWFDLKRLARGVAFDARVGAAVVFGYGDGEIVGSRWDPEAGVVHLDPAPGLPSQFLCDRAGDRIHALDDDSVTSWSYRDGRLLDRVYWALPELPEYQGWDLLAAATVPGTRALAALFMHEEAFAERQPPHGYRVVLTDPDRGRHRGGDDLEYPGTGPRYRGVAVLPPGIRAPARSEGPILAEARPQVLAGATVVLAGDELRAGWIDGVPRLLGSGYQAGAGMIGGLSVIEPGTGRALARGDLPEAWRAVPAPPLADRRRGIAMGSKRPRLVAGRRAACLVEDTGATARVSLLRPDGEILLTEIERASVGGLAVDDDAGEIVACLLPRERGARRGLATWSMEGGAAGAARSGLTCWDEIQALSPDGSRVYGMKRDRGTLLIGDPRTGRVLHEIPGRPRGVQPDMARRLWANAGGDTVYMAWRSEGESGEYSTRRVLLPEETVTEIPARNLGPVAFQPGGRRAALVWRHQQVVLWARDSPEPEPSGLDLGGLSVADLAWSADGRFLVVAPGFGGGRHPDPELWLWDVRERAEAGRIPVPAGVPVALAFPGDGQGLYMVLEGGAVVAWEAEAVLEEARRR